MEEENLINVVCDLIQFDKDRITKGQLPRIEVESFTLSIFWTQFGKSVETLSNEVNKMSLMCSKKPFPKNSEVANMLQYMVQCYNLMRELYQVLPRDVGETLFTGVTTAVEAIMATLLDFVHSLRDISDNGAKQRLTLTGTFLDACNAVDALSQDNLQATEKVSENELGLTTDAPEELTAPPSGSPFLLNQQDSLVDCRSNETHQQKSPTDKVVETESSARTVDDVQDTEITLRSNSLTQDSCRLATPTWNDESFQSKKDQNDAVTKAENDSDTISQNSQNKKKRKQNRRKKRIFRPDGTFYRITLKPPFLFNQQHFNMGSRPSEAHQKTAIYPSSSKVFVTESSARTVDDVQDTEITQRSNSLSQDSCRLATPTWNNESFQSKKDQNDAVTKAENDSDTIPQNSQNKKRRQNRRKKRIFRPDGTFYRITLKVNETGQEVPNNSWKSRTKMCPRNIEKEMKPDGNDGQQSSSTQNISDPTSRNLSKFDDTAIPSNTMVSSYNSYNKISKGNEMLLDSSVFKVVSDIESKPIILTRSDYDNLKKWIRVQLAWNRTPNSSTMQEYINSSKKLLSDFETNPDDPKFEYFTDVERQTKSKDLKSKLEELLAMKKIIDTEPDKFEMFIYTAHSEEKVKNSATNTKSLVEEKQNKNERFISDETFVPNRIVMQRDWIKMFINNWVKSQKIQDKPPTLKTLLDTIQSKQKKVEKFYGDNFSCKANTRKKMAGHMMQLERLREIKKLIDAEWSNCFDPDSKLPSKYPVYCDILNMDVRDLLSIDDSEGEVQKMQNIHMVLPLPPDNCPDFIQLYSHCSISEILENIAKTNPELRSNSWKVYSEWRDEFNCRHASIGMNGKSLKVLEAEGFKARVTQSYYAHFEKSDYELNIPTSVLATKPSSSSVEEGYTTSSPHTHNTSRPLFSDLPNIPSSSLHTQTNTKSLLDNPPGIPPCYPSFSSVKDHPLASMQIHPNISSQLGGSPNMPSLPSLFSFIEGGSLSSSHNSQPLSSLLGNAPYIQSLPPSFSSINYASTSLHADAITYQDFLAGLPPNIQSLPSSAKLKVFRFFKSQLSGNSNHSDPLRRSMPMNIEQITLSRTSYSTNIHHDLSLAGHLYDSKTHQQNINLPQPLLPKRTVERLSEMIDGNDTFPTII